MALVTKGLNRSCRESNEIYGVGSSLNSRSSNASSITNNNDYYVVRQANFFLTPTNTNNHRTRFVRLFHSTKTDSD